MPKYQTTEQDFRFFTTCVKKWQKRLGLTGWDIRTVHTAKDRDHRARVEWNYLAKSAVIFLVKKPNTESTKTQADIENSALHEVLHLLLLDISLHAENVAAANLIESLEHAIIQRLCHALLERPEEK